MRTFLIVIALAALSCAASLASNLTGPEGGWMNKTLTGPIVRGGGSGPPGGCQGAIDLSAGCPLPMLGVM